MWNILHQPSIVLPLSVCSRKSEYPCHACGSGPEVGGGVQHESGQPSPFASHHQKPCPAGPWHGVTPCKPLPDRLGPWYGVSTCKPPSYTHRSFVGADDINASNQGKWILLLLFCGYAKLIRKPPTVNFHGLIFMNSTNPSTIWHKSSAMSACWTNYFLESKFGRYTAIFLKNQISENAGPSLEHLKST